MATSPYFSTSNQYIKYDIHVDETAVDSSNNTSTVRVYVLAWRTNNYTTDDAGTCYVSIDGSNYSQSWTYGQKPISYNSDTVMFDKTVTVPHDPDGSKTIYVSAYFQHNRFSSNNQGFNVTLTPIARAATLVAAQDFQDTGNPQITYNNPAGETVTTLQACISLDGTTDNVPYRDISKTGTTYTFSLTNAERQTLRNATPNSNTLTVYFIVKTVLSGQTFTSSLTKVMTITDAAPTMTAVSYQDTNAATMAIMGDVTKIIQANSTLSFLFGTLKSYKGADLASVSATINGETISQALSGNRQDMVILSYGAINSAYDIEATVKLTDTRGNFVTHDFTITMVAWELPTAETRLQRKDNYYDETWLWVRSTISSLEGNNVGTIQYQYKKTDEANYGPLTTIADSTTTTLSLDNTKAYNFRIIVSDLLGQTTYNVVLQQGLPILFIDRLRRSVGIGAIPTEDNQLVADRRVSLKNLSQEIVADWWSVAGANYRGAALQIYEQTGIILTLLGIDGTNGTGRLTLRNASDNDILAMNGGANGGRISVKKANGDEVALLNSNSYDGGNLQLKNNDGRMTINAWTGSAGDGTINLYDGAVNNTLTINLSGATGTITANKFRYRNGLPELYDGSLSSGSTTFSANYSAFVIIGHVTSSGSCISCTVPVAMLSSTPEKFCISDEVNYMTFNVSVSGTTATLSIDSAPTGGFIEKVYGML